MDNTKITLEKIAKESKIKKSIKLFCYVAIISIAILYISFGLERSKAVKLVNEYKENKKNFIAEKVMTNPSIKIKYNDNDIYQIKAKKAFHKDESEVTLEEVEAEGKIGKIKAGKLKISQEGDRLIFKENPELILNRN